MIEANNGRGFWFNVSAQSNKSYFIKRSIIGFLLISLWFLSGCAETKLIAHTAKQIRKLSETPAIAKPIYKVGNAYQIKGVWYYPKIDYGYDETGVASWYGPKFHNKLTANGEIFDQNEVTAAHRTLPMPSVVRVTNLENGRALTVRINDRGPFAHGRIIDLSRRSSQLLGFERQGVAKVRVQILPRETRKVVKLAKSGIVGAISAKSISVPIPDAIPIQAVDTKSLAPIPGTSVLNETGMKEDKVIHSRISSIDLIKLGNSSNVLNLPVGNSPLFVQVAAFSNIMTAQKLKNKLVEAMLTKVTKVMVDGRPLFRVRIGPLRGITEADSVLQSLISQGFPGARVIVGR